VQLVKRRALELCNFAGHALPILTTAPGRKTAAAGGPDPLCRRT
jgi:hypothetical protein